jgi:hypothetical protein
MDRCSMSGHASQVSPYSGAVHFGVLELHRSDAHHRYARMRHFSLIPSAVSERVDATRL